MVIPELQLLIKALKGDKRLAGNCITFGVQGIDMNYKEAQTLLIKEGFAFREIMKEEIMLDANSSHKDAIHQTVFFKMLGFSTTDSIDYFPNEDPTYVIDLNEPIKEELWDNYDMVFDGGTLEHCFNVKEVLSNAVRLLRVGGRVVHLVPMSGVINHGYYMFSPILFYEFYKTNQFTEIESRILVFGDDRKAYWFDYSPQMFLPVDFFGKYAMLLFSARKTVTSNSILTPVQGCWFDKFNDTAGRTAVPMTEAIRIKKRVKNILMTMPFIYTLARGVYSRWQFFSKTTRNKL
jgi:SAM-dependent methyltransferase